jgi:hypothetical protein
MTAARDIVMLCPAGLESVLVAAAGSELNRFRAARQSSGYVRGQVTASTSDLRAFPCATNVFAIVTESPRTNQRRELLALRNSLLVLPRPVGLPSRSTFRVRVHDDGAFAPSTPETRELERAIANWTQLTPSAGSGRIEFWVVRRREQPDTVLAIKLTPPRVPPPAGSLRPELAACMARVDDLGGLPLVLDPFAGSGQLGMACLDAGTESVWLNDIDLSALANRIGRGQRPNVKVSSGDFRLLFPRAHSVSALVTDPPWGQFSPPRGGIRQLYWDLGLLAAHALEPNAPLVVLSGAGQAATDALLGASQAMLIREIPVLVNGRKASIIHART